jgi:para-nitrobenzyl esterase
MPKKQGSKEEKMIIETSYGKMTGVDHGDYMEYRKVPYANPPVGNRRFKAPERPEA